ncbi:hypothetical protein [Silvimonas sp.]|uniref:nickel/cobalt transporter n=1 Tax=Silvimonas sp. TaxID=2650811 RepID=UPI0028459BE0|nr:hypothetical protein [Silvimonas sp.]MDR3428186.1 hypothetical protein [Silvimonas sp.]
MLNLVFTLRLRAKITLWLALLLAACLLAGPAHAVDYFGRPVSPVASSTASAPIAAALAAPQEAPSQLSKLPYPVRMAVGQIVQWQSQLNAILREHLQESRQSHSNAALWGIVLISFIYGVLHAAGPGHGKVVIGSYFLTQRARVLHGVAMSAWAATVQALSAIVLVGGLAALFDSGTLKILGHAAALQMISYAILGAMGLLMLWRLARGLDTCGCEPDAATARSVSPLRMPPKRSGNAAVAANKLTYRAQGAANASRNWRQMALTGVAVGLRPCTGAILVLIFCLANGIFMTGVISTFAMALGVAITVSLISLGSMGINRLLPAHGHSGGWQRTLSWTGASLIALFGLTQTILLATGVIAPTLG